jgi:parallel beta-helix repeat protein
MVVNSTLSSNGFGIVLSGSSKNNTIVNNTLSSNAWGVYFGDYANSDLIYNNYFKNIINVFLRLVGQTGGILLKQQE